MSFDYLMVRAPEGAIPDLSADEDLEAALLAFAEAFGGKPIGGLDAVKASISGLFPSLRWQQQKFEMAPHLLVSQLGDWSWSTTSGADAPEFSLGLDEDGQVRIISASRVEHDELKRVAKALGLLVLDEQTLEMLSG